MPSNVSVMGLFAAMNASRLSKAYHPITPGKNVVVTAQQGGGYLVIDERQAAYQMDVNQLQRYVSNRGFELHAGWIAV